jgi:hypothetical protein
MKNATLNVETKYVNTIHQPTRTTTPQSQTHQQAIMAKDVAQDVNIHILTTTFMIRRLNLAGKDLALRIRMASNNTGT